MKLLNISNNIDDFTLEVLSRVSEAASSLNIDFFVIGASARDIILRLVHNIHIYRATNDIDFSVRVRNWDDFNELKSKLIENGFSPSDVVHRFSYKTMPGIDIIPFGKISLNSDSIIWPDDSAKNMSVLGFEECFADAESIKVQNIPELIIKVASLRGLVIMKLISWKDGFPARSRDAQDIFYIMKNYLDAGNRERLFEGHKDLINDDFDYELTGAILLGQDIRKIANNSTLSFIKELLDDEINKQNNSQFMKDMSSAFMTSDDYDDKIKYCLKMLLNLRQGLLK